MTRSALAVTALVVFLAAPFVLLGLTAPFDDPGEGMHAQIARELLAHGDPFALTLHGVPYVDKPPLLYVLVGAALAVGGEREAAARVVPALAALAAVAATAWLGTRLLGLGGGVVAGLALLTSAGFFAYARYLRPETLFVAALAWGFALTLVGVGERRRGLVVAGLAAFGLAALAKDPLGALAPPLAIGLALAGARQARPLGRWLPWPGVVAGGALAVGWWALAERRTPGFVWYTVIDNHVLNLARARHFPDEDVPLGATEFLVVAALGAAPWVLAAAATVVALARRRAWRHPEEVPWIALALWAMGVLGLTTLSPFRLPHYGLPAYPAIALLAARAWREAGARRLAVAHAAGFGLLAVACAVLWAGDGGTFASLVLGTTDVATRKAGLGGHAPALPAWESLRPLLGAVGLTLGAGALALALAMRGARRAPVVTIVLATMLGTLPAVGAALARVAEQRTVASLAATLARDAGPGDVVAHEGPIENSGALEWYSGRRPVIVDGRRSVLGFGASLAGARDTFWAAPDLARAWAEPSRVWLLTTRRPERSVVAALPGARLVAAGGGRRLYVNR